LFDQISDELNQLIEIDEKNFFIIGEHDLEEKVKLK